MLFGFLFRLFRPAGLIQRGARVTIRAAKCNDQSAFRAVPNDA